MGISKELQIGKAGEHLVCCDLIQQDFNAFLADQGLPFDVLVEIDGELKKVQVKTTQKLVTYEKAPNVYRFGTRRAKNARERVRCKDVDFFAFVALDIRKIAYLPILKMMTKDDKVKQTVDFKTRDKSYFGKTTKSGVHRKLPNKVKYIQDYGTFKP